MSEPKPMAALGAGLLARKGSARPAMRPQLAVLPGEDDLGWNDMGHPPAPPPPPVVAQQRELARRLADARRSALAEGRRCAFTLRVDAERHLRLRLACTLHGRSAQQLITEALDRFLAESSDLAALAAQVSVSRKRTFP